MTKFDILGVEWRSSRWTIGIVAFKTTSGWQAVVGQGSGMDEEFDTMEIAAWGTRLRKEEACAFFPNLKSEEYVP